MTENQIVKQGIIPPPPLITRFTPKIFLGYTERRKVKYGVGKFPRRTLRRQDEPLEETRKTIGRRRPPTEP